MGVIRNLLACFTVIIASAGAEVSAQQPNPPGGATPPEPAAAEATATPAAPVCGPTLYVVDKFAKLATVNVGTLAVNVIGSTGVTLTDIAFDPKTRKLYGISFNTFYVLDKTTGRATRIGSLGVSDANALVFNSAGIAYLAGFRNSGLYRVNVATGLATLLGPTGVYKSAGDLAYYNDKLTLAAYTGPTVTNSTPNYLVTLNPANGAVIGPAVAVATRALFGLASTGKNELYGLGVIGTTSTPALYWLFPAAPAGQRDLLVKNLSTAGVGQIYGAAYDGNYQP